MAVPVMAVASAVSAATGIVNAISGTSDAAKRRTYEQNLAFLSADDKKKLDKMLISAKSEEAKQQILAATLGSIGSARVGALATVQAEKEKTKKTLLVVGLIAGAVIIGGLVFILSKRK
jgi:hypothetical protein